MATSEAEPMELHLELGPMPADPHAGGIIDGLRNLRENQALCDLVLEVGEQRFLAHKAVLASASPRLCECLLSLPSVSKDGMEQKSVLKLTEVSSPEAVQMMLTCIYGPSAGDGFEYNPSSGEINRDVLRLAQHFQIQHLQDQAARWLAKGLSTANVLERLVACEEFGLVDVREKILEQLTANPDALFVLAKDPAVLKVPAVLQDLLVRVLNLLGCDPSTQRSGQSKAQGKQAKKAGA